METFELPTIDQVLAEQVTHAPHSDPFCRTRSCPGEHGALDDLEKLLVLELLKRMAVSGFVPKAHLRASWALLAGNAPWLARMAWVRFLEARSWQSRLQVETCPLEPSWCILVVLLYVSGKIVVIDAQGEQESLECCFIWLIFLAISIPGCAWTKGHYDIQGGFSGLQVLSRVARKTGGAQEFLNFLKVPGRYF